LFGVFVAYMKLIDFVHIEIGPALYALCPGFTDTRDRLSGLRGVDGGEQQTAPVLPGRVQA
jgi:hypothetical protein